MFSPNNYIIIIIIIYIIIIKFLVLFCSRCSFQNQNQIHVLFTLLDHNNGFVSLFMQGIVFGTGIHSEFGSVFQMMKEEEVYRYLLKVLYRK